MAKPEPAFECTDLALSAVQALIEADLIKTNLVIPESEPDEDADPDDESESWRDVMSDEQVAAYDGLEALLEKHRDKLSLITEIHGQLLDIAEGDYRSDFSSLAGIEVCTALEKLTIWTTDRTLDLAPLAKLPALAEVDLTFAHVDNLQPLATIPNLKTVIGTVEGRAKTDLEKRGVAILEKRPAD